MEAVDLKPFLRQKVREWKMAKQKNPHLKSLEQVGEELLGICLSCTTNCGRRRPRVWEKNPGLEVAALFIGLGKPSFSD